MWLLKQTCNSCFIVVAVVFFSFFVFFKHSATKEVNYNNCVHIRLFGVLYFSPQAVEIHYQLFTFTSACCGRWKMGHSACKTQRQHKATLKFAKRGWTESTCCGVCLRWLLFFHIDWVHFVITENDCFNTCFSSWPLESCVMNKIYC